MANALPDLKLLRIFVSVVRHQGFASAQQELNLSTSAISTYMSQLEAALGLVLCHRGRGGFSLTSKGELFHQETLRLHRPAVLAAGPRTLGSRRRCLHPANSGR